MKKFISKKTNKKSKQKLFFITAMFSLGIIISYKNFEKSKVKIKDKDLVNLVVSSTFKENDSLITNLIEETTKIVNPIKLLNKNYKTSSKKVVMKEEQKPSKPKIYIYNTHQTEEYKATNYVEFTLNPTVQMNNYILEDIFNKNGYKTIVEERRIKDILNQNKWNYASSYRASRIFLEESIINYPSLEYFIDVHRDSLPKAKTTITIGDKDYAKVLFLIGMENPNYSKNLTLTEKINNKINELYPGLSKGIYKKGGPGVNGVYNQDFSNNTILIEMGGYENTTTEVLNTSIAFATAFLEVINEETV